MCPIICELSQFSLNKNPYMFWIYTSKYNNKLRITIELFVYIKNRAISTNPLFLISKTFFLDDKKEKHPFEAGKVFESNVCSFDSFLATNQVKKKLRLNIVKLDGGMKSEELFTRKITREANVHQKSYEAKVTETWPILLLCQ